MGRKLITGRRKSARLPNRAALTQAMVREWLDFDPSTGCFRWRRGRRAGHQAGFASGPHGWPYLKLLGFMWKASRLAWFFVHGRHPKPEIDHINRNPWDNRIANLRECDRSTNCHNTTRTRRNNRSGLKGIWRTRSGRWRAYINFNNRRIGLGRFDDKLEALAARVSAEVRLGL